ncbi:MAG: NADH-quinone oxidoreductase subunit H [Pirellulales bacterium]|nr:NADH-quinone oxidoreductase subunit H [Pirellulales bacterium]
MLLPLTLEALLKIALLIAGLMTAAAYFVLLERWIAAWVQDRLGPNRVGVPLTKIRLFGLGQPIADGVKFLFKAEFTPGHVDKFIYFLAPMSIFAAAILVFAVIPFGSALPPNIFPASWGVGEPIQLVAAPGIDVGMIYVFAVGSIAVYGVVLGGWASNNKYSFLGGLRSGAQLISYELPLGLGILGVVLASGSLRLETIISQQAQSGAWNCFLQPLGFLVFAVASFAEAGRLPFDLPEAEQELVGGYHTEYSGIKLMMYLVAEFLHMITASFLIAILFLGGWHFWGLTDGGGPDGNTVTWVVAVLRIIVLLAKVMAMILFFMVVRWSWPRFRYDQLMDIGWKVMIPWGLANLIAVAVWVEYGDRIAHSLGLPPLLCMGLCGFVILLLGWYVATKADPTLNDNRPRRRLISPDRHVEKIEV